MALWERLARVFRRSTGVERKAAERILLEADFGVDATEAILAEVSRAADGDFRAALERAVRVPIRFLGVGEGLEDLAVFEAVRYARRLVSQ